MDTIRRTSDAVVSRWDDALAPGATLELGQDDRAVLTWSGKVLGVLGPGQRVLSPSTIPGLGDAVSGDDLEAELWFVRVEPVPVKFGARAKVQGPSGQSGQVAASGVATVTIEDPGAVAGACIDAGPELFLEQLGVTLQEVLQARLASTPLAHLDALASAGLAVLAADANQKLGALGAKVVRVASLQLQVDPALVAQPAAPQPTAASSAGSCPACGAANQSGRFCIECGHSLAVPGVCSACGAKVIAGAAFCTECGQKV